MKKIKLVTSIAPKNIENQKKALQTWIESGFDIISCNVKKEIELVKAEFPEVEFVEMKRDGHELMGKPCPYIYDMLQVLKERADEICGIVNSDIHLRNFTQEMYQTVWKDAHEEIHFMRRNDVESIEDITKMKYDMFFGGIDVFIFQKKDIECIQDDGLLMGQAMWDYWLPIMFCENGKKVREILNPVIFHVKHELGWNDDITRQLSDKICGKHFKNSSLDDSVNFLKEKFFRILSMPNIGKCLEMERLENKEILITCKPEHKEKMRKRISAQTHKCIKVVDENEIETISYDYAIRLPYDLEIDNAFVSTVIWIMETFQEAIIHVMPYARGKLSKELEIGNCCTVALKRLQKELEAICAWKKGTTIEKDIKLCTTCICSICIEDDEKIIWEREKFSGKVLVYPAGYMARKWVKRYRNIAKNVEILGFVDSMKKMQGIDVDGISVFSPEIISKQENYDKVLVVSNIYQEEIYEMLREIIPEEKIVVWNEYSSKNLGKVCAELC